MRRRLPFGRNPISVRPGNGWMKKINLKNVMTKKFSFLYKSFENYCK
jgi:hypothetical protein